NNEYRASLIYHHINIQNDVDDSVTSSLFIPELRNKDFDSIVEERSEKGHNIALNLGFRKTLLPARERKLDGFYSMGLQFGYVLADVTEETVETSTTFELNSDNRRNIHRLQVENDKKGFDIRGNFRISYPLNHRTYFGTGIFAHYADMKEDGKFSYTFTLVDTVYTSTGDWDGTVKTSSSQKGNTKYETNEMLFRIPVGLEYWFTNNQQWAVRFGSVFTQTARTENILYNPTEVRPYIAEIYYPDQPEPYILYTNNDYVIASESTSSRHSETIYTYGVGYQPSNNLRIDVMGLFDAANTDIWNSNFFRNLKLSFTLGF
ncbi:MAG: hypothetical protein U1C33_07205, partial [Candidatus Cloacimonadaceae bacterium]|nr:hypothetical protein [Candidatus Cloacimonadaceae bacterium]